MALEDRALERGRAGIEAFDPAGDVLLARRAGEERRAVRRQRGLVGPGAVAVRRHALGERDQERLLRGGHLPQHATQDASEARLLVGAHQASTPLSRPPCSAPADEARRPGTAR